MIDGILYLIVTGNVNFSRNLFGLLLLINYADKLIIIILD